MGIDLDWAALVGSIWDISGLSRHGFELGNLIRVPCVFFVGLAGIGLNWATLSGYHMVFCVLCRHGFELGNPIRVPYVFFVGSVGRAKIWSTTSGSHMCFSWAQYAWGRSGQPHLGPVRVFGRPSVHGLEPVNHTLVPYGFI